MSDVVNAELLTNADARMLNDVAGFLNHEINLVNSHEYASKIRALIIRLQSRLQAEAPEDAEVLREVMLALEDLSFECFSPIAPCNPPSVATYSRTFDVLDRHRKARGWATVPKTAISKPRTSQAEAQAPAVTQKREREGHKYADHDGTSDCAHGCGAWMGPFRSGAPNGINPFGECPKAPLLPTPAQAEAQAPTTAALTKIAVHREVVAAIQSFTAGVNMFEAANEAASCIIALQTTTAASQEQLVKLHDELCARSREEYSRGHTNAGQRFSDQAVGVSKAIAATTAVLTEDDRRIYNQSMTRYWEKASDELMAARLRAIIDRLTSTVGAPAPAPTREQQLETALRDLLDIAECWETVTGGKQFRLEDSDTVKRALALIAKGDTP